MNGTDILSAFADINEADVTSALDNENIRREFRRAKKRKIELTVSACLCLVAVTVTAVAVWNTRIGRAKTGAASGAVIAEVAPEPGTEPAAAGETVMAGGTVTPAAPVPAEGATAVTPAETVPQGMAETTVAYTQGYSPDEPKTATVTRPAASERAQVAETATSVPATVNIPARVTVPATAADPEYEDGYAGLPNVASASGGINIPVIPQNTGVIETGERISDAEAAEYFRNDRSVLNSLSASGVPVDNAVISSKGYSHVCYTGAENEHPEVRQNFRDYLVYSEGRLVSIITLYKENGKIYATPAFGAAWFDDYNDFLNAHKGQRLLYVYAGGTELIFTPDGKAYSTLGYTNLNDYTGGRTDLYQLFYHPDAVFVP
ncbi:MAG: hypothetical protein K6G90_08750 [Clostridia bacterium]|nr:hypothetical protein [Clostridia bacterium]